METKIKKIDELEIKTIGVHPTDTTTQIQTKKFISYKINPSIYNSNVDKITYDIDFDTDWKYSAETRWVRHLLYPLRTTFEDNPNARVTDIWFKDVSKHHDEQILYLIDCVISQNNSSKVIGLRNWTEYLGQSNGTVYREVTDIKSSQEYKKAGWTKLTIHPALLALFQDKTALKCILNSGRINFKTCERADGEQGLVVKSNWKCYRMKLFGRHPFMGNPNIPEFQNVPFWKRLKYLFNGERPVILYWGEFTLSPQSNGDYSIDRIKERRELTIKKNNEWIFDPRDKA